MCGFQVLSLCCRRTMIPASERKTRRRGRLEGRRVRCSQYESIGQDGTGTSVELPGWTEVDLSKEAGLGSVCSLCM